MSILSLRTISIAPFVAITLASFAAAPANAAPANAAPTQERVVKVSDLNLATASGVAKLQRRIEIAARAVCSSSNTRSLAERASYDACHDAALKAARQQADEMIAQVQTGNQVASAISVH